MRNYSKEYIQNLKNWKCNIKELMQTLSLVKLIWNIVLLIIEYRNIIKLYQKIIEN